MADVFELSASLRMDLSGFESSVARAEQLAARLEQRLSQLSRSAALTMGSIQRAVSVTVGLPAAAAQTDSLGTRAVAQAMATGQSAAADLAPRTAVAHSAGADDLGDAVARALRGVSVQMDGHAVGCLVAATVDEQIGRAALERRYTG